MGSSPVLEDGLQDGGSVETSAPPGAPRAGRPRLAWLAFVLGLFVLGDNRDRSFDSRSWGVVPVENLIGYAELVYWSWGRDGLNWDRLGLAL